MLAPRSPNARREITDAWSGGASDEGFLERVLAYRETEPYKKALRKRKVWVEPMFAKAKEWHGMRRFRLRRLWRVNLEAMVIAAAKT